MINIEDFKGIEDILVSFLGESKNGISDSGQMQFACPRCVDEKGPNEATKFNLEVNLFKLVFKCWSCGEIDDEMTGKLSKLIKNYGNKTLYKQYKEDVKKLVDSNMYELDAFEFANSAKGEKESIFLPKTFRKINLEYCKNRRVVEYLQKRKIDQSIIDKFNIGYTTWNEEDWTLKNRIIIPSYNSFDELNYWVGRDFTDKSFMKYQNCTAEKKSIVFQESHIDFDADIVLCEGAIDCLYVYNAISMLGKVLKKDSELYRMLMEKANSDIIICLDSDTKIGETKRVYKTLNRGRLKGKIWYIRMNKYKDFGEVYEAEGKKGIIDTLKTKQKFTEIDLVFEE